MSTIIKLKRGNKGNISTGSVDVAGEPIYAKDTGEILVRDDTGVARPLKIDIADVLNMPTMQAISRAANELIGGGIITYSSTGNLKWSSRIMVMNEGKGSHLSTTGYFQIDCPTSGTIPKTDGTNVTVTANGIPLTSWDALYYILPIGAGGPCIASNFRISNYSTNFVIPYNWVKIAQRNLDSSLLQLFNGEVIPFAGGTYTPASFVNDVINIYDSNQGFTHKMVFENGRLIDYTQEY